jgi:hypothetical protein
MKSHDCLKAERHRSGLSGATSSRGNRGRFAVSGFNPAVVVGIAAERTGIAAGAPRSKSFKIQWAKLGFHVYKLLTDKKRKPREIAALLGIVQMDGASPAIADRS